MLQEKICLKYREETGALDATLLNAKQIQNRHNETLAQIVEIWKPVVDKPKDIATDLMVYFFLSPLIWIDRDQIYHRTSSLHKFLVF
jgi:hypothetical protein